MKLINKFIYVTLTGLKISYDQKFNYLNLNDNKIFELSYEYLQKYPFNLAFIIIF